MPPKKRDKEAESSKNPRMDHIQADHELFLQAFESKYLPLLLQWISLNADSSDNYELILIQFHY